MIYFLVDSWQLFASVLQDCFTCTGAIDDCPDIREITLRGLAVIDRYKTATKQNRTWNIYVVLVSSVPPDLCGTKSHILSIWTYRGRELRLWLVAFSAPSTFVNQQLNEVNVIPFCVLCLIMAFKETVNGFWNYTIHGYGILLMSNHLRSQIQNVEILTLFL